MAPLLDSLWLLGVETQYSCQGHPDRYIPNEEQTWPWDAHIVFADIDQAVKFLTKSIELLEFVPWSDGRMNLRPMVPFEDGVIRASVGFPPSLLGDLTNAWVAFEKTVPAAVAT